MEYIDCFDEKTTRNGSEPEHDNYYSITEEIRGKLLELKLHHTYGSRDC